MATFLADVVGNTIALIPAILIGIGVNIGLETLSNTLGLESETDITVFAMNLLSSIVVSFVVGVVQSTAQFGLSRF
ncbi:MAG: hypothetical protein HYZ49_11810 [Chloroflexi bacterium]|nr:hypothetical protein [Chloroflexota bacterium]